MKLTMKQLRVGTGMRQSDVAKKLGINEAKYNAYETLDQEMLEKIAKLYGVQASDIKVGDMKCTA